jgi:hypothetical protein
MFGRGIQMSNQTINLDLEKSRLECPPEKIYGKGVNFKKRIRVKRDQVTWSGLLNPSRVDINLKQHIKDLTDSYIVHGFIHSEPPQVIYVDPKNPKRYIGLAGHNRNGAQEKLNWDVAIYDVVEFDTPQDMITFSFESNDLLPRAGSTLKDISNGIKNAIKEKWLENKDDAIKAFIKKIASFKTPSQRRTIFKQVRNNIGVIESMRPLDSDSATDLAEELKVPYKGDEGFESSGEFGYLKEPLGFKTILYLGLKLWLDKDEDMLITGYVNHPDPSNLKRKRVAIKKEIQTMNSMLYEIASKLTDMPIDEIKKKDKSPFLFNGFLPQVLTADPANMGLPTETGLVNENGQSIE